MSQANVKRRFLRFGLRSVFVGVAVVALIFAYVGNTARAYYQERVVFAQLPSLTVLEPDSGWGFSLFDPPGRVTVQYSGPAGFQTLSESVGISYFNRAVSLSLQGPTYTDAMIEQIGKLDHLHSLSLRDTGITRGGLQRLRRVLPNCQIEYER